MPRVSGRAGAWIAPSAFQGWVRQQTIGKELALPRTGSEVEIQGKRLKLSNLDKVLYPEAGFTKAQVIDYYVRIAPAMLRHLRGRPLTMKRYPEGVGGFFFYEKNCPTHRPDWVKTARIWSEGNQRWMQYCLVEDLPTLVWAANLADLELHTSLSLARNMGRPTVMVFDLDPGAPANILQCTRVSLWLRAILDNFGLEAYPKTSGSKGLQLYVPLKSRVTYGETKPFAHELAKLLEVQHPELVVSDMKKSLRVGKVFVDWSQNDQHKTTICVYSLRARERPTVSTPVTWEEVERAHREQDPGLLVFEPAQVIERYQRMGDLFGPVLTTKQRLPPVDTIRALREETEGTVGTPGRRGPLAARSAAPARTRKRKVAK